MNKAAVVNKRHLKYNTIDPVNKVEYAHALVMYMKTGFDLKVSRLIGVKVFYIMIVPLLILMIKEFFHGEMTLTAYIINTMLLYIINFIIWSFYFKEEIIQYEDLSLEMTRMKNEITALE